MSERALGYPHSAKRLGGQIGLRGDRQQTCRPLQAELPDVPRRRQRRGQSCRSVMNWLSQLNISNPVAHAIGVLSLVCVAGMALGSVKMRGIGLGTSGVLFAGILTGHFGKPVDH